MHYMGAYQELTVLSRSNPRDLTRVKAAEIVYANCAGCTSYPTDSTNAFVSGDGRQIVLYEGKLPVGKMGDGHPIPFTECQALAPEHVVTKLGPSGSGCENFRLMNNPQPYRLNPDGSVTPISS